MNAYRGRRSVDGNDGFDSRVCMTVEPATANDLVTVYWRPGCPFCARLRWRLRKAGLETTEVNIWADPDAAAVVRSIAHGDETVPTVVIAGEGLVNPPARVVLDAVRAIAPESLPALKPKRRGRRS